MTDLAMKAGSISELERCVRKKLQRLSNNSSNIALGEKLFIKKQLELPPFKAVPFSGWGNWEQNPLNNRSWQWRLNWLSFLSHLMACHCASGNVAAMDLACQAIQSWLDSYLETDTSYHFEFIWHDHGTALRAEQMVLFIYYCRQQALDWQNTHSEFLDYLEQGLVVHGQWLASDSFYSEHTNHGLEQARVLLLLGTVFEGEQARQWQQIAIQRIRSELSFSFTDEGIHLENSPAYHIFVFKVFLGIIKDYPEEMLEGLSEQFNLFSVKSLEFITYILRPDGNLPPIGDTEQLPTSDAFQEMFGHRTEYQHFLYAKTQGRQGVRPSALNRVYPKTGYAIFRDQWPTNESYSQAFHLIVKAGCTSRYHHHQDEGHISIYAGGEDWLIDSGLYNYNRKDPIRNYMRSRRAHNVPLITNASYSNDFQHRLDAWKVVNFSEDNAQPFFEMSSRVLEPLTHWRRVSFERDSCVTEVADIITSGDDLARDITLQWHFPSDKTIDIEGEKVVVRSPLGSCLRIAFWGDSPDQLCVSCGKKSELIFSLTSLRFGDFAASQVVLAHFNARKELNVATRFSFVFVEHDARRKSRP